MIKKLYHLPEEKRERIKHKLKNILENHKEIEFAFLYGSFLEKLPFHDLDLGIYVQNIVKSSATTYALALIGELSRDLKIPVDVQVINFAPLTFIFNVLRGELIINRNDDLLSNIMEQTIKKYLDLKPVLYKATKEAFSS
ncbi:MAG: nucleotidyltransferase domain-containing protein [Thermodesulfobacteriota bacterium]